MAKKTTPDKPLNEKQSQFCREYVIDYNGKQAAIRAGYSEKTAENQASRLLSNDKVATYLAELTEKKANNAEIDALWVLRQAKELHLRCMQSYPVLDRDGDPVMIEDGEGNVVPAYKFDSAGANKALEIVGKHVDVQAFKERVEHKHVVEDMTDDTLEQKIAQLMGKSD